MGGPGTGWFSVGEEGGGRVGTLGYVLLNEQWRMPDAGDRSSTPTRREGGDSESLRKRGGGKQVWSRAGGGPLGMRRKTPDHTEDRPGERTCGLCESAGAGDTTRNN